MKVQVASGEIHYATGFGRFNHLMLQVVWYIPNFGSTLFSDTVAMRDGYSCARMGQSLIYSIDGEAVLEGTFVKTRWILTFESSGAPSKTRQARACGTGMGLMPVSAQTVLMHRRCNHAEATTLYMAQRRNLTSGLCAGSHAASLTNLCAIDCIACSLAKSRYAAHRKQHLQLALEDRDRQRVPGHLTPWGIHGGLAPYELVALDLMTDLPPTHHRCTICMIVVCLYSMKRHSIAL